MDQLILEVQTPGLHHYYPVSDGKTRIGRAYDNDIILSDPTIAPHHFEIVSTENTITITNLADINPLSINGRSSIEVSPGDLSLPFKLGRLQVVLRHREEAVVTTRPIAGKSSLTNPFGHWLWAVLLVAACLLTGVFEYYFDSYQKLSLVQMLKHLISETLIVLLACVIGFSILEKLLVNRWEIKQVLVAVAIVYLLGSIVEPLGNLATFYFSSGIPGTLTMLAWFLVFIPVGITFYLVHISHLAVKRSAFIAILVSAPLAIPPIMQDQTLAFYFRDFSAEAHYQQTLSAFNLHHQPTLSIDRFIDQAAHLEAGKRSD